MATLDERRAAAQQALGKLGGLMKLIPAAHRNDPAEIEEWLREAALLPVKKQEAADAITDAVIAVQGWREAADQQNEFAALYHDSRIRKAAEATGRDIDWYRQRPAEAVNALMDLRYTNPGLLPDGLYDRALNAAIAGRIEYEEAGIEEPDAFGPVPANAAMREAEIEELAEKSIRGKLTEAEDRRYNQLLAARLEKEQDAEDKAIAEYTKSQPTGPGSAVFRKPPAPTGRVSEFDNLMDKSLKGELSEDEDGRLNELIEAREIAAGRLPEPSLDSDEHEIITADQEE